MSRDLSPVSIKALKGRTRCCWEKYSERYVA